MLFHPLGVAVDAAGNLYIADSGNNRIQMVPKISGTFFGQNMTANDMYTIAGDNLGSYGQINDGMDVGNGGPATSALLSTPANIALDSLGNLYIADMNNNSIQMVPQVSGTYFGQNMTANYMYSVVGDNSGMPGFIGDGGPAANARLYGPFCGGR